MRTGAQRKPATISDVALAAGVSVPTVSRVLNGSVPVSSSRRQSVMQAIDELNYRPSAVARALANQRSSLIAVLAANTSRFGYAMTLEGVEQAARAAGYLTMITVLESDDAAHVGATVDIALSQPVAGVIVLAYEEVGTAAVGAVPEGVPMAVATGEGRQRGRTAHLSIAERSAAERAVNHLLELGHRTVHHIALPSGNIRWGRTAGWSSALTKAGATVPELLVSNWDALSGYEIGRRLAADPEVTAVFCGNDIVAIGVLRAMHEAGRHVPDDVSIVGFDDEPLAELWMPGLTTVHQDFAELGRRVFGLLESQMDGSTAPPGRPVSAPLVVRGTTAAPAHRSAR